MFRAQQIHANSGSQIVVLLIGNKSDADDERAVPYNKGKELAKSLGYRFFESSAKENVNIKAAFECLVDLVVELHQSMLEEDISLERNEVRGRFARSVHFV